MPELTEVKIKPAKPSINLVQKIQAILEERECSLAEFFSSIPAIEQVKNEPPERQRIAINRELRLVLGAKEEDTSIARLALDDTCMMQEYFRNFKKYVVPSLRS